MKSNRLKDDLVIILITSFILIVCWIGFTIYNKSVSSTIDDTLTKEILPISPTFDTATITNLSNRQKITPLYTLTQTEEASESAVTPTPDLPRPVLTPTILPEEPTLTPTPSEDDTTQTFEEIPDASEGADITP